LIMSAEIWAGAILGAVVSAIIIPLCVSGLLWLRRWWVESRPSRQLLEGIAQQGEPCLVFIRDFFITLDPQNPLNTPLQAVEPRKGVGVIPNVSELWADVDARGLAYTLNVLGQAGKTKNVSLLRMSEDPGLWNAHIVVIGGQSQKSFDFYDRLENVMYYMDGGNIYEAETRAIVARESGYGYGVILKARNKLKTQGSPGVGLLIGGFGTLGTAAAGYYLKEHFRDLGRQFGKRCFGIIVRASVAAGEESVERLTQYDRVEAKS